MLTGSVITENEVTSDPVPLVVGIAISAGSAIPSPPIFFPNSRIAFAMTRAFLPAMRAQKSGNVIFIASMTSYIGMPQVMGYSAAKSGVLGMIRALTAEVGGDGIRVNGIAPGWIDTPMLHRAVDQDIPRQQKILGRTPMMKYGEPEDIGWAAVYLCSDAAKFVTGTVIPVDGGALNGF